MHSHSITAIYQMQRCYTEQLFFHSLSPPFVSRCSMRLCDEQQVHAERKKNTTGFVSNTLDIRSSDVVVRLVKTLFHFFNTLTYLL